MDSTIRGLGLLAALSLVAAAAGCGGSEPTAPPSITLSLASPNLAVTQGGTATEPITVARANFGGRLVLSASGLPAGVAATFTPSVLTRTDASSTLVLSAGAGAAIGSWSITVSAQGDGVESRVATLALSVNPAGDFVLSLAPATVAVPQSGNTSAVVTVARSGGLTGGVVLGVTGLPAGVTAIFTPATLGITATTSTLTLTTSGDAATGTVDVTITATTPGLAAHRAALALSISPAAGTPASVHFCANGFPVWFAYQNDGGGWTHASLVNGTATFTATGTRVGVAAAFVNDTGSEVELSYVTTSELASLGRTHCGAGEKTVYGSAAGLAPLDSGAVWLGAASASAVGDGPFEVDRVPGGVLDLVAVRSVVDGSGSSTPIGIIVRRSLDVALGATMPVLDFGGAEAGAPATATLRIAGPGNSAASAATSILTAHGVRLDFHRHYAPNGAGTVYGLPAGMQVGSDLYVFAGESDDDATDSRSAKRYASSFGDAAVTLGPSMSASTVTEAAHEPYVRMRVQLPKQREYGSLFSAVFSTSPLSFGGIASISITMSPAYLGDATTWDATVPDLSVVPGWDPSWGLDESATNFWRVSVVGASYDPFTAVPDDGATEVETDRWPPGVLLVSRGALGVMPNARRSQP